jgi:hypothetical protein
MQRTTHNAQHANAPPADLDALPMASLPAQWSRHAPLEVHRKPPRVLGLRGLEQIVQNACAAPKGSLVESTAAEDYKPTEAKSA